MSHEPVPAHLRRDNAPASPPRIGAFLLRRALARLPCGQITLTLPDGSVVRHAGGEAGPQASLTIHRWRAVRKLLTGGDIGLAESFAAGDWTTPDLTAVLEFGAVNAARVDKLVAGSGPVRLWNLARHGLRRNSRTGSRRNITFHYDLGNAFYALWLDRSMTYSSAIYPTATASLEEAQDTKIRRIGDLLDVKPGQSVLEIGSGWGALALHLAGRGAHVTGVTLSHEQLAQASALPAPAQAGGSANFVLKDYRDVTGTFDRIVSIEMIEAVGEKYWPRYFQALRDCLKPGGLALLQVITIAEDRFESYRRSADFIQRYIFPGGMLLTPSIIAEQGRRVGLSLCASETFGQSYARTLEEWRRRFLGQADALERMGFDLRFRRMWEYYLSYCEAGFRSGAIDVGLYTLKG